MAHTPRLSPSVLALKEELTREKLRSQRVDQLLRDLRSELHPSECNKGSLSSDDGRMSPPPPRGSRRVSPVSLERCPHPGAQDCHLSTRRQPEDHRQAPVPQHSCSRCGGIKKGGRGLAGQPGRPDTPPRRKTPPATDILPRPPAKPHAVAPPAELLTCPPTEPLPPSSEPLPRYFNTSHDTFQLSPDSLSATLPTSPQLRVPASQRPPTSTSPPKPHTADQTEVVEIPLEDTEPVEVVEERVQQHAATHESPTTYPPAATPQNHTRDPSPSMTPAPLPPPLPSSPPRGQSGSPTDEGSVVYGIDVLTASRALGPFLESLFEEVLQAIAVVPTGHFPTLARYIQRTELSRAAWSECVSQLLTTQRFLPPFIKEDELLFRDVIVSKMNRLLEGHTVKEGARRCLNVRMALHGPKESGKSTTLHLLAAEGVIPHLLRNNTWSRTFLLPLNFDVLFGSGMRELAIVYCQITHHFVDALLAQRPQLRPWAVPIASFWKNAVTQKHTPRLPSDFVQRYEQTASIWTHHVALLQRLYHSGAYGSFLSGCLAIPDVFRHTLDFDRVLWLVDSVDQCDLVYRDEGGAGKEQSVSLGEAIIDSLQGPQTFVIMTSPDEATDPMVSPASLPSYLPHVRLVGMHGLIPTSTLTTVYPDIPTVIKCGGKSYPVDVFGGCPGYLVPFVSLLLNDAKPRVEANTVEFYGEAVAKLLDRLSALRWVGR